MPFTIDVCQKGDVHVQFRIIKNNIGIYLFNGTAHQREQVLRNWRHLESHFVDSLLHHKEWVRGPDAPHLKLNHSSADEIEIMHWHIEFSKPVDPDILSNYLNGILAQQRTHGADCNFISLEQIEDILVPFRHYYADFVGSSWKADFDRETTLTRAEEAAYERACIRAKSRRSMPMFFDSSPELLLLLMAMRHDAGIPRLGVTASPAAMIFELASAASRPPLHHAEAMAEPRLPASAGAASDTLAVSSALAALARKDLSPRSTAHPATDGDEKSREHSCTMS